MRDDSPNLPSRRSVQWSQHASTFHSSDQRPGRDSGWLCFGPANAYHRLDSSRCSQHAHRSPCRNRCLPRSRRQGRSERSPAVKWHSTLWAYRERNRQKKRATETPSHKDNGSQFGEWAAEGSPTEGHRDPRTRNALTPGVSCSRIAVSFRGAYAPLAELDGLLQPPTLAHTVTSTPRPKLRELRCSVCSARRRIPSKRLRN